MKEILEVKRVGICIWICLLICFSLRADGGAVSGAVENALQNRVEDLRTALARYDYSGAIRIIDTMLSDAKDPSTEYVLSSTQIRDLSLQKVRCLKKLLKYSEGITVITSLMEMGDTIDAAVDTASASVGIDVELLSELADCHLLSGNVKDALQCYFTLSMTNPANIYFKVQIASLLYKSENYGDCIAVAKGILATDSIPAIISLVANSYNLMSNKDSALFYYSRLMEINPMNTKALSSMSSLLLKDKQYDTVLTLTGDYIDKYGDDLIINPVYGITLYLKSDYKKSA